MIAINAHLADLLEKFMPTIRHGTSVGSILEQSAQSAEKAYAKRDVVDVGEDGREDTGNAFV